MTSTAPSPLFTLSSVGVTATAQERGGQFVVLAGSQARAEVVPSFEKYAPAGYQTLRASLLRDGKLAPDPATGHLRFTEDVPFRGSTPAAVVILARNADGTREWIWSTPDGATASHGDWLRHTDRTLTGAAAPTPDWQPFFRELAVRLLEFEQLQPELIQLLRDAGVHLQHDEGEPLAVLDPFSFFSLILKHQSDARVIDILSVIRDRLGLHGPLPTNLTGVPWSNPMNAWFFAYRSHRQDTDLPTLWALARQAVAGDLHADTFAAALTIRQVALPKLTQGLFWLNPERYLALNGVNIPYLEGRGLTHAGRVQTLADYDAVLDASRPLASGYPALSHEAWLTAQRGKSVAVMDGEAFPFEAFQDEAAGFAHDPVKGNAHLDRRYAPLLLTLATAVDSLARLKPSRQPYTGKSLGVKISLGQGENRDLFWLGYALLFPEPTAENRRVSEAGLRLKVTFPDGLHETIRDGLRDEELFQQLLDAIVSAGEHPGEFALNAQFELNDSIPASQDTRVQIDAHLRRYAAGTGHSTRLQVDQFLGQAVLESETFSERLAEALQHLDRVAGAMDQVIRAGHQFRTTHPATSTIEVEAVHESAAVPTEYQPVPGAPLNQILYGPPGTGKTFRVVDEALSILDPGMGLAHPGTQGRAARKARYDELAAQQRISFVTFHQSFGYEDFIEGIKPVMQGGQLSYHLEDGIFLNAVRAAGGVLAHPRAETGPAHTHHLPADVNAGGQVWRMYIDKTASPSPIRELSLQRSELRMGNWSKTPRDLSDASVEELSARQLLFRDSVRVGDLVLLATGMNSIGAVGVVTGDYRFDPEGHPLFAADYTHARAVRWLATDLDLSAVDVTGKQFSPPALQRVADVTPAQVLGRIPGVQSPADRPPRLQPHVLIIDEINRGNVSKIFGELITLLEAGKRAGSGEALTATLPLSRRPLSVPQSLYVIGTMNTADRSLTLLDAALRRRFVFRPVWPEPEVLPVIEIGGDALDLRKFLYVINERIERLLSREQVIGHAYLLGLPATLEGVASALRERILPLLEEYFFEDWSKIRTVLADEGKEEALQFIHVHKTGGELRYRVNEAAFQDIEAFTLVYSRTDDAAFPFSS